MFMRYLLPTTSGSYTEASRFPETMVPTYHTVRRHNQEGSKIKDCNMIMNGQEAKTLKGWLLRTGRQSALAEENHDQNHK
jgi:hypothetical protein